MLRTVRSFPTLRVLDSTVKHEIATQSKNFSCAAAQVSSKYNLVVPNIPHHEMSSNFRPLARGVHQSSKQNQSKFLSSKTNEFSMMSVQALKLECRKRGLKVSGRKIELVARISDYEVSSSRETVNAMSTKARPSNVKIDLQNDQKLRRDIPKAFSSTASKPAKGDSSSIDFIKPVDIKNQKLVDDDYIVKIPSLTTEASSKPVTKIEKQLEESKDTNINQTIVSKADGSEAKIFQSTPKKVEEQSTDALKVVDEPIAEYPENAGQEQPEEQLKDEPYEYEDKDISSTDKTFFASVAAVVGVWWLFKPKAKKK